LLSATDVRFAYGAPEVLRGVSLTIRSRDLVGILGPNGSGKTTLLRLLAGHLAPDAGSVTLDGAEVSGIPRTALARRMAVVPQETHLAFDYSVLEMVLMGRYPHLGPFELEGPRDVAIARAALAATGTAGFEARSFNTLSGGEKQRVVIASALAQLDRGAGRASSDGGVLLLDEPTASLDPAGTQRIEELCHELKRQYTIVIVTHNMQQAARVSDYTAFFYMGELIEIDRTSQLFTKPAKEQTEAYLTGRFG